MASINYFYRSKKKNTCGIQAKVRDIMMDTLDALVYEFKLYIKIENRLISHLECIS